MHATATTLPMDTATSRDEHLVDVIHDAMRHEAGIAAEARHILDEVLHPDLAQAFNNLIPRSANHA